MEIDSGHKRKDSHKTSRAPQLGLNMKLAFSEEKTFPILQKI
jgi:hypothetical protein